MLIKDKEFKERAIEKIAEEMCLAARTAPKGKGIDLIESAIIKDKTIKKLSDAMIKIGDHKTFIRDSENILRASAIVLIGTKKHYMGLKYCGFCGFANCAETEKAKAICAFVPGDLGIAIGSAASVAMDHRVDNRIMYTVGRAAIDIGLFDYQVVIAYGIPLSATGKNPFFDRK
jgi:uncharacterized ferredoxin-like protein